MYASYIPISGGEKNIIAENGEVDIQYLKSFFDALLYYFVCLQPVYSYKLLSTNVLPWVKLETKTDTFFLSNLYFPRLLAD